MGLYSIASIIGVYESDLEKLLKGQTSYGIASKLNVSESDLQKFLEGKSTYNLATRICTSESDLQTLLNKAGKEGAIGIIVGMLIPQHL